MEVELKTAMHLKRVVRQYGEVPVAGIVMISAATWVGFQLHFNLSSATSLHLFLVILVALRWGFWQASLTSFLSVALLDYFFAQPLFVFFLSDRHDWVALITFECVALLVSRLSTRMKEHSQEAITQRLRLQKLYELSQGILLLDRHRAPEQQVVDLIRTILSLDGVALWDAYQIRLYGSGKCDIAEYELRSVFFTESDLDDLARGVCKRVLHIGARATGALVLIGSNLDSDSASAAATLAAIAIERARSFSAESNAEAEKQSEQLRSTVLDALAHAYKTPLAAILSSSSGLLEVGSLSEFQREMVTLISNEAEHLTDLTNRLLRTAKLDQNSLKLNRTSLDLNELAKDVIRQHEIQDSDNYIEFIEPSAPVIVFADPQLLRMAFEQLLDNALKYAPAFSGVRIKVGERAMEGFLCVHNKGTYIAPEERQRIFTRFYRSPGSEHRASGTGVGLSVVKRITTAHQGRAWVDSDYALGTEFFMSLPKIAKEK